MLSPDVSACEKSTSVMGDQPFAASAMGDSMDSHLLPELSGKTCVAAIHLDEVTGDLPPSGSEPDLITASHIDKTLITVREWVRTGSPPSWSDCSGTTLVASTVREFHRQSSVALQGPAGDGIAVGSAIG